MQPFSVGGAVVRAKMKKADMLRLIVERGMEGFTNPNHTWQMELICDMSLVFDNGRFLNKIYSKC